MGHDESWAVANLAMSIRVLTAGNLLVTNGFGVVNSDKADKPALDIMAGSAVFIGDAVQVGMTSSIATHTYARPLDLHVSR